jgi:hypothetical protein
VAAKRTVDESDALAGSAGLEETDGRVGLGTSTAVRGLAELLASLADSNSSLTLG